MPRPTKARHYFLWCRTHGFGVRIWPTGKQVFYADYCNGGGARKRMMIGQHGKITCEEARKQAIEILGAVVKGDDPAEERATGRKSITVRELCERYLAAAERGLIMGKRGLPKKAGTIYIDRGRIARHIVPLLGKQARPRSGSADINKFIRDVTDGKTARSRRPRTSAARRWWRAGRHGRAHRRIARRHSELCSERGHHPDNPARGVRRPAGRRRKRRLSADEYKALGKALAAADARASRGS